MFSSLASISRNVCRKILDDVKHTKQQLNGAIEVNMEKDGINYK
jgi:hypothetical protein